MSDQDYRPDFTIELTSESLPNETEYALYTTAEELLRGLAEGHDDLTGAAISIEQPGSAETPHKFEATVVVYSRPDNVAATKVEPSAGQALDAALRSVERQIRSRREKLRKQWEAPGNSRPERESEIIGRARLLGELEE